MNKEHRDPIKIDLKAPRLGSKYNLLAQQKSFKFYQTRSNAIILYDALPAYCIPKAILMETGEIVDEKVDASPRPLPTISYKDNWMKEFCSEIAGGSEDSQQTQPKSKTQLLSTVRPVKSCVPMSLGRLGKDKDADENVDADQTITVRLEKSGQSIGLFTHREEINNDFRVFRLPQCSCETSRKLPCSRTREEDRRAKKRLPFHRILMQN